MNRTVLAYRAGARLARWTPRSFGLPLAEFGGRMVSRRGGSGPLLVARHLQRALGRPLEPGERKRLVGETYESYARYWYDSMRLPGLPIEEVDRHFSTDGFEHIEAAVASGTGPILALPHLGGWEWAAFWLSLVPKMGVTAVVEPLEPPELFEFFVSFRESLGMRIIPLGPEAAGEVARSIRDGRITCLLCDRDIGGGGVDVEFFGERTTLPAGPATLALRTGAPLLPVAVYVRGEGYHGKVMAPLPVAREGKLRDDVARITQLLAHALEGLIREAPTQWHLLQPNWPSDHVALGRARGLGVG